jgi:hypothetical protein
LLCELGQSIHWPKLVQFQLVTFSHALTLYSHSGSYICSTHQIFHLQDDFRHVKLNVRSPNGISILLLYIANQVYLRPTDPEIVIAQILTNICENLQLRKS